MESPLAISFEGTDSESLQERLTPALQEAGMELRETAPPATAGHVRGVDLPLWFSVITSILSAGVDVTSLTSFFMDLRDRRKRSASQQAQDVQLAKKFLDEVAQHEHLNAEVVLHNRKTGRVLRVSARTSASDVDEFRAEALQEAADE